MPDGARADDVAPDLDAVIGAHRASLLERRVDARRDEDRDLGHAIEAYTGMPKIFFKWLAYRSPEFRYAFLDNRVPKGQFPTTIARGNQIW